MLFGECTDLRLGNFVGKCIVGPDYWGKVWISTHSSKKKKKNKPKLSMLLRLLSNVLGVLDRLLHLIENKIYEKIFNIPFILQEAEALMKLLVSERDAFSNHIYLSLVNLWETASSI